MASAAAAGLGVLGLARSPLPGQDGNVEFFLWLGKDAGTQPGRLPHNPASGPTPGPALTILRLAASELMS